MAWIPSGQKINSFLNSWNSRQVLSNIRKNVEAITLESFRAGLTCILLAACRENDVVVLRELLPLSLRHYNIDHCYAYKLRTEKKIPGLVHGFESFSPEPSWMRYTAFGFEKETANFNPSVQLRGTLLHIAAQEGRLKVAQLLLSEGAKVDAVNCCGRTPLMMGIHHLDVAKYFINSAGCNVNHQDMWGQTALMLVVWKAKTCRSLLKPLLDAGANPRIADQYGKTMVHYACELIIDGDTIPYLIENNLLDIEYGNNGRVLYEGIPLVITHGFSHFMKSKYSGQFPPVFFAYLSYCELLSTENLQSFLKMLPVVLNRIQLLGVSYKYAPADAVYGYRKEITTIDEFRFNLLTASSPNHEALYQRLIIAERLVGQNSHVCILLLWDIIQTNDGNLKKIDQICRWLEKLRCFLEKYRSNSLTIELFSHVNIEKLRFVGLTRQHKLWFECLSRYAKIVKLLANSGMVHVHQYSFFPSYSVAVLPFGTTYILQNTPTFIPNAVFMLLYLIFKVNEKFDEALYQELVSPCEVHLYSPAATICQLQGQGLMLVQQSSILYTYLAKCQPVIDNYDISVCAKICEMSTADLVNAPVPDRQTLLHFAVKIGNIQLVDFLLDRGAHPDAVEAEGLTPAESINANGDSVLSAILAKLLPQRLFCIAAKAIVDGGLPYRKIGLLPVTVVDRILMHDKTRFL